MKIGVPREVLEGERRVALDPESVPGLTKAGWEVVVETQAGSEAGFEDVAYRDAGAQIADDAGALLGGVDVIVKVQPPSVRPDGSDEVADLRRGAALVSLLRPLDEPDLAERLASQGVNAFALELMPRVTRAQSMDVLSSQSTIAGYRAVLLAATILPRVFPMLVTAAGTLKPAKVLVIGAGVAGLQALGTAKRLGAVTAAYDTREAVKEQVQSIGAKFVQLKIDTGDAEDAGGYAKAQTEEFYVRQREELAKHVAASDIVITTALVPGQRAPLLITEEAVRAMRPGSVVVDLAAEKGGNCAACVTGQSVVVDGVTIVGNTNLPAEVPAHASQMFAKNVTTFLDHLVSEQKLEVDLDDEITAGTLVTHEGAVVHKVVLGQLGKSGPARDSDEGDSNA